MKRIFILISAILLILNIASAQTVYNIVRLQDYSRLTSNTYILKDTSTLIHMIRDSAFFGGAWVHKNMTVGNFARMLDQISTLNGSKIWLQNSYGYRENDTTQYIGVGTTRPLARFTVRDSLTNVFGIGATIPLFGPPMYFPFIVSDFDSYVSGIYVDGNGLGHAIEFAQNKNINVNDTLMIQAGQTIINGPIQLFCSMFSAGNVLTVDAFGNASWQAPSSANQWSLIGNAGTDPTINFIGTTDSEDLIFRVNNIVAGMLQQYVNGSNVGYGNNVLSNYNTTGIQNVAVGNQALHSNTGSFNVAVGESALHSNTSGGTNTAVGRISMGNNNSGNSNTAVGYISLENNTIGNNNTVVGSNSGSTIIGGSNNTLLGDRADVVLSSTSGAIAIGNSAIANSNQFVIPDAITGVRLGTLPSYASDAAAGVGGLVTGDHYWYTGLVGVTLEAVKQ